jgi:hypothetical protein
MIINYMQDPEQYKDKIHETMINLMAVLYDIGIRKIHTGAIMRLLGVENETAAEYDDSFIELDERFPVIFSQVNNTEPTPPPPGTTFH